MQLKISDFKMKGIFSLSISGQRGVTFCFKNEPLESVQVSSTFDEIAAIKRFLQNEIQERLNQLLNEDLPLMLHSYFKEKKEREKESKDKEGQEQYAMRRTRSFVLNEERRHSETCPGHRHSSSSTISVGNGIIKRSYSRLKPYKDDVDFHSDILPNYTSRKYQRPLLLSPSEIDGLRLCSLEKSNYEEEHVCRSFFGDNLMLGKAHSESLSTCNCLYEMKRREKENIEGNERNNNDGDWNNNDVTNNDKDPNEKRYGTTIHPTKRTQMMRLIKSNQTMSPYVINFEHAKFRSTPGIVKQRAENNLNCKSRTSIASFLK
jgi:hypothetical protein